MNILPLISKLFHPDGRTDRQTDKQTDRGDKVKSHYSQF